jgi:hypothetical protein
MKVIAEAKKPEEPEKPQYQKHYQYKDREYSNRRGGYNYQSYRGRGYRGRGRAGARGRGYKNRYDEDRYFQEGTYTQFVELPDTTQPIKDIKEDSAEDDFQFSDNNKSPSPKKQKLVVEKVVSPKKIVIEDQSNIFTKNETPKNIISNIKEFIDTPVEKKNIPSSGVSIQNSSFNLINKQPERIPERQQVHTVTSTQTTYTKPPTTKKETPVVPPEGTYPYMMPYPMYYYPPGTDPNIQGQYPPMYYCAYPYGMNPQDFEEMRRKGTVPNMPVMPGMMPMPGMNPMPTQYNTGEMSQPYPYTAPFNYYYSSPYGQIGMNPMMNSPNENPYTQKK